MNIPQRSIFFFISVIITCLVVPAGLAAQEKDRTVAVLPFHLNAPPDHQYLAEGLRDMLSSRLRTEAGVRIVSKADINSAIQVAGGQPAAGNMQPFAEKMGADYLIYGTITALGGGISIDAKAFTAEAVEAGDVHDFYASAVSNEQVMRAIDSLSWDIIEKLFGKKRPASMLPVQQQASVQADRPSFTTVHPDKTFMSSGGGFSLRSGRNFTKTRNFNMELRGFDVGDVDGDGTAEVILADKSEVKVFRRDGTRLNQMAVIEMLVRYPVHAVNTADLNGNGRAEIYISASDPQTPGSRAVEWDGTAFVDLFKEARWYIRPMEVPQSGLVLLGQAGGQLAVEPGIFILSNADGSLSRQEKLPVPESVNLFNFAFADLDGDGQHEIVAIDDSSKLRVIRKGATTWKSTERFAGTKRFLGGEPAMKGGGALKNEEADGVGKRYERVYIPSRILVSDVDRDGTDDIILNRNPESLSTMLPNLQQYPSGTLVGLKWNGLGLEELWRTRKIDGYVVDYQVKSLAARSEKIGGEDELFIGMMLEAGSLNPFGGDQSTVVIYPFEFEMPESK